MSVGLTMTVGQAQPLQLSRFGPRLPDMEFVAFNVACPRVLVALTSSRP
jgi:hypothetical protein